METTLRIIDFLGEDNVEKLKTGITDLLLKQVESDLEDKYRYDYIIAFDDIYNDIKEEIEDEFKEKLFEIYREQMEKQIKVITGKVGQ